MELYFVSKWFISMCLFVVLCCYKFFGIILDFVIVLFWCGRVLKGCSFDFVLFVISYCFLSFYYDDFLY